MRPVFVHRSIGVMACLAMLLILLAPVVSRWLAHAPAAAPPRDVQPTHAVAHRDHAVHPADHQHDQRSVRQGHTGQPAVQTLAADPHALHAMAAALAGPMQAPSHGDAVQDPHAGHEMGVECDYCLIAARMLGLLVALLIALIGWCTLRFTVLLRLPAGGRVDIGHLGARGPPQRC